MESGSFDPPLYTVVTVLKYFGIDLIQDANELSGMEEKLNEIYHDLVYMRECEWVDTHGEDTERLYLNSLLVDKYFVLKYAYCIVKNKENESLDKLEEIIENEFIQTGILEKSDLQIYLDSKATRFKNSNKLNEAIALYEESKLIGNFKYSYGMVCYHLSAIYTITRNYLEAYRYDKEALVIFNNELNYERQKYLQINLANIESIAGQFNRADEMYRELLISNLEKEMKYLVHINLVWNLMKQEKWESAISELKRINENYKTKQKWYYFIACSYYRLDNKEKALEMINESKSVSNDDVVSASKINCIVYLISDNETKVKISKILEEYKKIENQLNIEDKLFYLDVLYELYTSIFHYKEANQYLIKKIKLSVA